MSKIFCGITEVPKGQRRGSQEECYNKGQVRYYGVKKLKKSLLVEQKVSVKTHLKSLMIEISGNRGKIRKLKIDYDRQVNPDKKKIIKKEAEKIINKNKKLLKKYNKLKEGKDKKSKRKSKHSRQRRRSYRYKLTKK